MRQMSTTNPANTTNPTNPGNPTRRSRVDSEQKRVFKDTLEKLNWDSAVLEDSLLDLLQEELHLSPLSLGGKPLLLDERGDTDLDNDIYYWVDLEKIHEILGIKPNSILTLCRISIQASNLKLPISTVFPPQSTAAHLLVLGPEKRFIPIILFIGYLMSMKRFHLVDPQNNALKTQKKVKAAIDCFTKQMVKQFGLTKCVPKPKRMASKEAELLRKELEDQQKELEDQQKELEDQQKELEDLRKELEAQQKEREKAKRQFETHMSGTYRFMKYLPEIIRKIRSGSLRSEFPGQGRLQQVASYLTNTLSISPGLAKKITNNLDLAGIKGLRPDTLAPVIPITSPAPAPVAPPAPSRGFKEMAKILAQAKGFQTQLMGYGCSEKEANTQVKMLLDEELGLSSQSHKPESEEQESSG
jgi:hypothetical protein